MLFHAKSPQTSYGEDIGILLLDTNVPFIQGDVANAKSYNYPVRYKRVDKLTAEAIFAHDRSFLDAMIAAARELEQEGVRAITGDCGFMALFQREVKNAVSIPVFLSSLIQLPLIGQTLREEQRIGIITANKNALTPDLLAAVGCTGTDNYVIKGLENTVYFRKAAIDEAGTLDSDCIREEVLSVALHLAQDPLVGALLLECSLLPVYGQAVSLATNLPVFDFLTMIDFVQSSLVKKSFPDSF